MKNVFKMFGIILLVAVIGFSMAACGDDDSGGGSSAGGGGSSGAGSGGTFTLTGIPSKYNGLNANLEGQSDHYNVRVSGTVTRISNGRVSIPMWEEDSSSYTKRYSGNDILGFTVSIISDAYDDIAYASFDAVTFSKGSATKSWSDASFSYDHKEGK